MKWAMLGFVALALTGTIAHYLIKQAALREAEEQERIAAQSRLDLSNMPEPASKPVEPPKKPKITGARPVIVELDVRAKKKGTTLTAPYRVLNSAGEIVSEDQVPPPGELIVLILSPGEYQLQVPERKFKHAFTIAAEDGEKKSVKVRVR